MPGKRIYHSGTPREICEPIGPGEFLPRTDGRVTSVVTGLEGDGFLLFQTTEGDTLPVVQLFTEEKDPEMLTPAQRVLTTLFHVGWMPGGTLVFEAGEIVRPTKEIADNG